MYQLYEKLQNYVTDQEREEMSAKLQSTEDWLYEDGEDEIKSVYVAKLAELKKVRVQQYPCFWEGLYTYSKFIVLHEYLPCGPCQNV